MREMLASGYAGKIQCIITSPPYYGLRDYGVDGQIGLEDSPDAYVARLVEVFREVRRTLTDDGTLWLNIGDSYNAHPGQRKTADAAGNKQKSLRGSTSAPSRSVDGLKPKDLIGIPWLLAFALRADGWYLRQDIIWHKPNPMPESVRDRCTKAHEYLFLLSKSERYFFDSDAMKEPSAGWPIGKPKGSRGRQGYSSASGMNKNPQRDSYGGIGGDGESRNKRSVWTIPTESYSEAHFATFPKALVEPCILAGSRPGDIIFDPFLGSGTVAQVAQRLGRHWIGCELNPKYIDLQHGRTRQRGLVLES